MIKLKSLLKEDILIKSYPREHIKYVLGIDVPLNESIAISPELYPIILMEQELYENFIENSKKWLKKQYKKVKGKVVTKVDAYTDLVKILTRIMSDPKLLDFDFSLTFLEDVYDKIIKVFLNMVKKIKNQPALKKLGKFFQKIIKLVKDGWEWVKKQGKIGKFIMAVALGALIYKLKELFKKGVDFFKDFVSGELNIWEKMKELFPKLGDFSLEAIKSTMSNTIKSAVGPTITAIAGIVGSVDDVVTILDPTLDKIEASTREKLKK